MWTLTYSFRGVKEVQVIPAPLVAALKPLVARGREYRDALTKLLIINARLLRLWRKQQSARRRKMNRRKTAKR